MFDHKALLDAFGPRGWRLAHWVRLVLWRVFRPMRLGALAVVRDEQGRVLLVENSYMPGQWQLPGGGVEKGEAASEAIARELVEEVGFVPDSLHLHGLVFCRQYGAYVQALIFSARAPAAALKVDGIEILRGCWADPAALPAGVLPLTACLIACVATGAALPPRWPLKSAD